MFKTRKRKFTKTAPKIKSKQSSSEEDNDEPSVVKNNDRYNNSQKRNPNLQKTAKRRAYIKNSSDEEKEANAPDVRFESNIQVTQESTKSAKPAPDFHNAFSNKDRYETRLDEDFESQIRKYGRNGFHQNSADLFDTNKEANAIGNLAAGLKAGVLGQNKIGQANKKMVLKKATRIAKNTPNHAISHDDNVNPETGEKFKGYAETPKMTHTAQSTESGTTNRQNKRGDPDATYAGRMDENNELLYKGGKQYTDWNPMQKKDPGTKLIRAVRGPVRAPTFMRVTSRWDYEKSTCRDWRECGYCVFGDCCKYIHDRSDLKHGWELEDKWIEMNGIVDSDNDYTVSSADEDGEDLPFKCFICRESYNEPIETLCKHYFCLKCAMTQFAKTQKCFICNKNTKGVFNPAKRIMAKIDRLANDGIDIEEKKTFGKKLGSSGSDSEDQSDPEEDPESRPGIDTNSRVIQPSDSGKAFYTRGNDVNITQEEEIENEIEIEEALVKEFGEKREDDSDIEDEDKRREEESKEQFALQLAEIGAGEEASGLIEADQAGAFNDNDATGASDPGGEAGPSAVVPPKKIRFSSEKLKSLLKEADKRDKKDEFERNLGRFLPKAPHVAGHQTTETLSFLKKFRDVTEYEVEQ